MASSRPLSSSTPPPDPAVLASAVEVLERVETLEPGATGVLQFDDVGAILVDEGRVCGALARSHREGVGGAARDEARRPAPRGPIEDAVRRGVESGTPLGESLAGSGLVPGAELRAALLHHHADALARLARTRRRPTRFSPQAGRPCDRRLAFSTIELLAAMSNPIDQARGDRAREHLDEVRLDDVVGVAFVRDAGGAGPAVIAVDPGCSLRVGETLEIGRWLTGLFDVTMLFDPKTKLISACWSGTTGVVAWRIDDVTYAAICISRPASTILLYQLASRLELGGVRYSGTLRVRR